MKKILIFSVLFFGVFFVFTQVNTVYGVINTYDEMDYITHGNDVGTNDSILGSMFLFDGAPSQAFIEGYSNNESSSTDVDYYSFVLKEYTNVKIYYTFDEQFITVDVNIVYHTYNSDTGSYNRIDFSSAELAQGVTLNPGVYAIEVTGTLLNNVLSLSNWYRLDFRSNVIDMSDLEREISYDDLMEMNVPYITWTNETIIDKMLVNFSADYVDGIKSGQLDDASLLPGFSESNLYQKIYILNPHYGIVLGILLQEIGEVMNQYNSEFDSISSVDDYFLYAVGKIVPTFVGGLVVDLTGYIVNRIQFDAAYSEYKDKINSVFTEAELNDEIAAFFDEFGMLNLIQEMITWNEYSDPSLLGLNISNFGCTLYGASLDMDDDIVVANLYQTFDIDYVAWFEHLTSDYQFKFETFEIINPDTIESFNTVVDNQYGTLRYQLKYDEYSVADQTVLGYTWQQGDSGSDYFSNYSDSYFSITEMEGTSEVMYTYQPTLRTEYYHKSYKYEKMDRVKFKIYKRDTVWGVFHDDEYIGTKTYYIDESPSTSNDADDYDYKRYYTSYSSTNYSSVYLPNSFAYGSYTVYLNDRSGVSDGQYFVKEIEVSEDYAKKRREEVDYHWGVKPVDYGDYTYNVYTSYTYYTDGFGTSRYAKVRHLSYYRKYYKVYTYATKVEYVWDYKVPEGYDNPVKTGESRYETREIKAD